MDEMMDAQGGIGSGRGRNIEHQIKNLTLIPIDIALGCMEKNIKH